MTSHPLRAFAVALFSAGWLLPLFWSARSFLDYLNLIYLPTLQGQVPLTSAPLDRMALASLQVACLWLFAAIAFWAYTGWMALARRRA